MKEIKETMIATFLTIFIVSSVLVGLAGLMGKEIDNSERVRNSFQDCIITDTNMTRGHTMWCYDNIK